MWKRVLAGLLVAPLFPAAVAALLAGFHGGVEFDTDTATAVALGCVVGGYIAAFSIGFPLSFVWQKFGWNSVAGGITLGVTSALGVTLALFLGALSFGFNLRVPWLIGVKNLLTFAMPLGALGGLAFWWFGFRSPNNSMETDAGGPRASG